MTDTTETLPPSQAQTEDSPSVVLAGIMAEATEVQRQLVWEAYAAGEIDAQYRFTNNTYRHEVEGSAQDVLDTLELVRQSIGALIFEASEYGIKYGRLYAISGAAAARNGTKEDLGRVDKARDELHALLGLSSLRGER